MLLQLQFVLFLLFTAESQPQCSTGRPGEYSCEVIALEDLPDCHDDYNRKPYLESCQYEYPTCPPSDIGPCDHEECADISLQDGCYRNDCEVTETSDLDITLVAHDKEYANITVSWESLHLNVSSGDRIDLKLFDSADCKLNCLGVFPFCIQRYFCTSNTSQTAHTISQVRYNTADTVQLAIVTPTGTSTVIRTQFAQDSSHFKCTSTDIFTYNIERCPPEVYGPVRGLSADVFYDETGNVMTNVSWQHPAKDDLFHASLHYHLTLTPLTSVHSDIQYFSVSYMESSPSVLIGGLDTSHNYTLGVRVYVNCSGCGIQWQNLTIVSSPPLTPPITHEPTTPPLTPESTTPPLTPPITHEPTTPPLTPEPTTPPSIPLVLVLVPLVLLGAVVLVLVLVLVLVAMCLKAYMKKSSSCQVPPPKPHPSILPTEIPYFNSDMPPQTECYIHLGLHNSLHDSGSSELAVDLTPDQDSPCTEVLWSHGDMWPRGCEESPERVLTCRESRVLFVYSLNIPESVKKDILSNLVQELTDTYEGISPVCCDIVSMRENPSKWLLDEVPKADVVLCVLTQDFVQDWKTESTVIGILNMIILAKVLKKEPYSNFATIMLNKHHEKLIPTLLQHKAKFMIDDLPGIARFIKDIPLCVLPEKGQTVRTVTGEDLANVTQCLPTAIAN